MIRHIVFFSAKTAGNLPQILDGLRLLQKIPHAQVLEVRENMLADALSAEVNVVVYGEFADQAALQAYKNHPLYQQAIDRVRPLRELRIAADISTTA